MYNNIKFNILKANPKAVALVATIAISCLIYIIVYRKKESPGSVELENGAKFSHDTLRMYSELKSNGVLMGSFVHKTIKGNYRCTLSLGNVLPTVESEFEGKHAGKYKSLAAAIFFSQYNCILFDRVETYSALLELLQMYKKSTEQEGHNRAVLSLILPAILSDNLNHFVTLVISYDGRFKAHYCDSFGTQLFSVSQAFKIPTADYPSNLNYQGIAYALRAAFGCNYDIKSSKVRQQQDRWNCGVLALENVKRITDMVREGRSFDEIEREREDNKHIYTEEWLNNRRRKICEDSINGTYNFWISRSRPRFVANLLENYHGR